MRLSQLPVATYRLQFHAGSTFQAASELVPYLRRLGVTHVYASPILQAAEGSTHGYDVVDPTRIWEAPGAEAGLDALVAALDAEGMGLILDIVPNHMAATAQNPWWRDLLENGEASVQATTFDVDWRAGDGRIVLAVLDGDLQGRLEALRLVGSVDGLALQVDGQAFPLDPATYPFALAATVPSLDGRVVAALRDAGERVGDRTPERRTVRARACLDVKRSLASVLDAHPDLAGRLAAGVGLEPDRARGLVDRQVYRLVDWRRAPQGVNYRRFFDINQLAGVQVEQESVFERAHGLVLRLLQEGKANGLRIDHVDGLLDPLGYLERLSKRLGAMVKDGRGCGQVHARAAPPVFLAVEKILVANERLPADWPVHGATGYEAGARIDGLFVDANGLDLVAEVYAWFLGRRKEFREEVHAAKLHVVATMFPGTFRDLAGRLHGLVARNGTGVPSVDELHDALVVTAASLPVYRTYVRGALVDGRDRAIVERTVQEATRRRPELDTALEVVRRVWLLDAPGDVSAQETADRLAWIGRWQQATGPVMAKGYEDTALYRYLGLVSLAEVGDDPESGSVWLESFHRFSAERLDDTPHALSATSTHDSKRSEDVRARLHVLSEVPREWRRHLERWRDWNRSRKRGVEGLPVPGPDMEYLVYETLVGAWPGPEGLEGFADRVAGYVVKAAREAKLRTDWLAPDLAYEAALVAFARSLVDAPQGDPFRDDLERFLQVVAYHGMLNGLSAVLLKCTMPGVPDVYQGQELLDLSLVDPDNRRPVDFAARARALAALEDRTTSGVDDLLVELLRHWRSGHIKLFATWRALNARRERAELFAHGEYLPVRTHGRWGRHVVAFARQREGAWALTAVPRSTVAMARSNAPIGREVWGSTRLRLPAGAPASWRNVFTGDVLTATAEGARRGLDAADVFDRFPVALLMAEAR